ncbi:hypothetical protein [Novosphingobium sp. KACC 22771]|uniref:hypothetical protein n=1 Tax=Novosphingobium sp. KACC 22771 TaxID=3025670 RepID=UPI00236571B8|nr:hypothetical protein [Novosphingobium sp. KACC 22771]WDF72643.1 hypothetical protein PQ467_00955 [Novosphingobium sp. KACC 22771]
MDAAPVLPHQPARYAMLLPIGLVVSPLDGLSLGPRAPIAACVTMPKAAQERA